MPPSFSKCSSSGYSFGIYLYVYTRLCITAYLCERDVIGKRHKERVRERKEWETEKKQIVYLCMLNSKSINCEFFSYYWFYISIDKNLNCEYLKSVMITFDMVGLDCFIVYIGDYQYRFDFFEHRLTIWPVVPRPTYKFWSMRRVVFLSYFFFYPCSVTRWDCDHFLMIKLLSVIQLHHFWIINDIRATMSPITKYITTFQQRSTFRFSHCTFRYTFIVVVNSFLYSFFF